jgi:hypothetical protein
MRWAINGGDVRIRSRYTIAAFGSCSCRKVSGAIRIVATAIECAKSAHLQTRVQEVRETELYFPGEDLLNFAGER